MHNQKIFLIKYVMIVVSIMNKIRLNIVLRVVMNNIHIILTQEENNVYKVVLKIIIKDKNNV